MDAAPQLNAALAGRYAVEREIGRGGMATVYLARDLRHDRRVALKVLNPELGAILGVERFLAEIKVTANLQHPNLLPLFDSGEVRGHPEQREGSALFYVMPYVDGESLRHRLNREKQLPVDEAVRIAVAIGSALDYAHRHGVIHRDLKPENILLHEGEPLIADFGIALAVSNAGGNRITQTGLSLGTPQYMSPEQATGDRQIDARTDVYSLGAVLYEMLTGDPPHLGSTSQAIIAKVLTDRPRPIRASRPSVPVQVEASVDRALEKLPADRFATARDFADALLGRVSVARETLPEVTPTRLAPEAPAGRMRRIVVPAGVGIALVAGGLAAGWFLRPEGPPLIPVRFTITPPAGAFIGSLYAASLAISPDGRSFAFIGGTSRMLYVRRLDELTSRPLAGTENAQLASFSPDGKWIAFWSGRLKKIPVDGGPTTTLSDVSIVDAVAWNNGDRIVIAVNGSLASIPAAGGKAEVFLRADTQNGRGLRWPRVLRDGKTVLFAATSPGTGAWRIGVTSIDGSGTTVLDIPGTFPLDARDGFVIYATRTGEIMAAPVDLDRRRVLGPPVTVVDKVRAASNGAVEAAVSDRGSLLYQSGSDLAQLDLIGKGGGSSPLGTAVRNFIYPRYSPDGRRVAVGITGGQTSDVWIYDVASATLQRLTTGEGSRPEWTPDGKRIVFRHDAGAGVEEIWWQRADGNGPAERLFVPPNPAPEAVVSPDGYFLIYRVNNPNTGRDLWYRRLSGDTTPRPIATGESDELEPRFSPDGKWLAYVSERAGRREVFIQPFPQLGTLTQISDDGGDEPLWSRDGTRVFYRSGNKFMSAVIAFGSEGPRVSREYLFSGEYPSGGVHANWDVAPDGRFLIPKPVGDGPQTVYVHDWRIELLARVGGRR
jgi:serine/threonine-protein kinase